MNWSMGNRLAGRRRGGGINAIIAGFVFLLLGGLGSWLILIRPLSGVLAARQWTATPCRVLSSEVQHHSGKSRTYSVNIRYAYTFNGHAYESSRYDFMGGSSSGYEGKAKIVAQYPPGSEATCWVNPQSPSEAVLERRFTSVMLFGLIPLLFVLIGIGVMVMGLRAPRPPDPALANTPWLARPDWATGLVKSDDKAGLWMTWGFAAAWNSIAFPTLFVLRNELAKSENKALWLVLLFPLVGVGLLAAAVYTTLKWRKFGASVFEMTSQPGVVGGALEGKIRLSQLVRPESGFKVRLQCIRRYVTGAGKNRSVHESILWEEERHTGGAGATDCIPVLFAIPGDKAETNGDNPDDQIVWRLSAAASLPGVDYGTRFEVPVFKLAQTPAQVAASQRAQASARADFAEYRPPLDSPIRVQPALGGGTEFYFPAARNVGAALGLTVFALIWTGALVLTIRLKAPVLFPVVIGLVELMVVVALARVWFWQTRVAVSVTGLNITGGMLGFTKTRTIPTGMVTGITTKVGMTAGTKSYHDIVVQLSGGQTTSAGSSVPDGLEARWLASEMWRGLGR